MFSIENIKLFLEDDLKETDDLDKSPHGTQYISDKRVKLQIPITKLIFYEYHNFFFEILNYWPQ